MQELPAELRFAVEAFKPLSEPAPIEARFKNEIEKIVYEPADTVFSRKWKLSKESHLGGSDPIVVNQMIAAGRPNMSRAPGTHHCDFLLFNGAPGT